MQAFVLDERLSPFNTGLPGNGIGLRVERVVAGRVRHLFHDGVWQS
jgi:hypothetical protein